ncbi:hypothetical protein Patl1_19074 [Pistacia atlantica]|uniref:Uncharacterized protein n=1 Tax=Pistacia atlantica TaxID=434234 RepID=A0ACC1C061_9ROSI|nr:hypothetical protein Patl1_19074 [Pistacia atlantica]
MPRRDSISWVAMIVGYAWSGYSEEALHLFVAMKIDCEIFIRSAFKSALSTCSNLVKVGFEASWFVRNTLLVMYCNCGSTEEAYHAFKEISNNDVVSMSMMIVGYVRHGFGNDALLLFKSMKTRSIKLDDKTVVGVLSACNHIGLIKTRKEYLYSMNQDYGITANYKHYTCMVDLFGEAKHLDEGHN